MNKNYVTWDEYFMALAKLSSIRSKDPELQVGAVIVSKDNRILSIGYNGAPNGFEDMDFPWTDKENRKYYICHAEMNAISNFNGNKKELYNSKIYITAFPCNECAKLIIQNGIKEVIYAANSQPTREKYIIAKLILDKCNIKIREFLLPCEIVIEPEDKGTKLIKKS